MHRHNPGMAIGLLLICLLYFSTPAIGDTFVVNSMADSHDISPGDGICADHSDPGQSYCTLRAAIEEASALPGADTIIVPGDTITVRLSLGPLLVTGDSTTIQGIDGYPAIDGTNNPHGTDILEITSNHNAIMGLTIRRAPRYGILVSGQHNVIGGDSVTHRNMFVGNGVDTEGSAVCISGENASNNTVAGNFVGVYGNGTEVFPNYNGIVLENSANNNTIGGQVPAARNIVTGNDNFGIVLRNHAHDNTVEGNTVGPNSTGALGEGNQAGGLLICSGANSNLIGGDSVSSRNLISLNRNDGITVTGQQTTGNRIEGNYIGVDSSGWISAANDANGVSILGGATGNFIGGDTEGTGNLISGNWGDGVNISGSGTSDNTVSGNAIGPSKRGSWLIAGDTYNNNGIVIEDGATNNTIGGATDLAGNHISANYYAGVSIRAAGTSGNRVIGNLIGVSSTGASSVPNGTGVEVRFGAHSNEIGGNETGEGNVISGNRGDFYPLGAGIAIYDPGTDNNIVQGNKIGTDINGTRALRNGSSGVIIGNGASGNLIGGDTPSAGNLISGNGVDTYASTLGRGVQIYGVGTDNNRVQGNTIGLNETLTDAIANQGIGVGIFDGARHNVIGGESESSGNTIAGNESHGLCIDYDATRFNTIRYNSFHDNDSLGIMIRNGAQDGIAPPVLTTADQVVVEGYDAPVNGYVDIYVASGDSTGFDEGSHFVGTGTANGTGEFSVVVPEDALAIGDSVTAIATDTLGSSSAFAANIVVTQRVSVDDHNENLPAHFALNQNYPNPFNPSTKITYSLPHQSQVELAVFNVLGQKITTIASGLKSAGEHEVHWNAIDHDGNPVSSGIYLYKLSTESYSETRKMLLLK